METTKSDFKPKDIVSCEFLGKEVVGVIYLSEYASLKIYYLLHNNKEVNYGTMPWYVEEKECIEGAKFSRGIQISKINSEIDFKEYGVSNVKKIELNNKQSLQLYGIEN
jgi:hypothetical protein